jgi:hypothetical protein
LQLLLRKEFRRASSPPNAIHGSPEGEGETPSIMNTFG